MFDTGSDSMVEETRTFAAISYEENGWTKKQKWKGF